VIFTLRMSNHLIDSGLVPAAGVNAVDDTDLSTRFLRQDDEDAFEILVRRYQERIFSLAISILGYRNETEAEDVTQETFIVLFRTLHTFRRECAFSTWFYRLARNRIVDHQRRMLRRAGRAASAVGSTPAETVVAKDALSTMVADQHHACLLAFIDQLPELQRIVLRLFYWQDHSTSEIAELLEINPNTAKSHLFRARQSLAVVLREEEPGDSR